MTLVRPPFKEYYDGKSSSDRIGPMKMHPPRECILLVSIPSVLVFSGSMEKDRTGTVHGGAIVGV
jgi:hypothetical protein